VALRRLYGLTPAEARLAQALVAGEHLNDIAEHLGITKETARSQLKAVFAKTDTHRQAELVRVLLLGVGRFAANGTAIDGSGLDR